MVLQENDDIFKFTPVKRGRVPKVLNSSLHCKELKKNSKNLFERNFLACSISMFIFLQGSRSMLVGNFIYTKWFETPSILYIFDKCIRQSTVIYFLLNLAPGSIFRVSKC